MRPRLLTVAMLAVAAPAMLAGCGGGVSQPAADSAPTATADRNGFRGGTVDQLKPAPELGLRTVGGELRRTSDYRGKVVFVTFVYANCPDVCPLIVDNLLNVKEDLGADGAKIAIVAVSVDPKGDTPARIKSFLSTHRATGKVDYLTGSAADLKRAWARWGIASRPSADNPALIEHSGVIWGVDPNGRRATFYPASGFTVDDIASDAKLLLSGASPA